MERAMSGCWIWKLSIGLAEYTWMWAVAKAHPAGTPVPGVRTQVNWPLMVRNLWLQYMLSERS
eukprot:28406-Heterocapsa_arctica.AAC.1